MMGAPLKRTFLLLSVILVNFVVSCDKEMLESLVRFLELDYEDQCVARNNANWDVLTRKEGAFQKKLETDKAFGYFVREHAEEATHITDNDISIQEPLLRRKLELIKMPGDALLNTEQWNKMMTFADSASYKLLYSTDYDCIDKKCTLPELRNALAETSNETVVKRMRQSWQEKLPDPDTYTTQVLPLLKNSSVLNGYESVEKYWDAMSEFEGALQRAREIWDQVRPLYTKLHKYTAMKMKLLEKEIPEENVLPIHLFKSLLGEDWSNIAPSLFPKHREIYEQINSNLQRMHVGGRRAYLKANNLVERLFGTETEQRVWETSVFNGSCPASMLTICKTEAVRIVSCGDISLENYLNAHETLARARYKEIASAYSNNTYMLKEANRYSALYEAIPGLVSLLALTPHALNEAKLFTLKRFNNNEERYRLILLMIAALRDIPKLNYYLAVDEWRLKMLTMDPTPQKLSKSWREFRKAFSQIDVGETDILGDPAVLYNEPYIAKFMGIILKYQIYQSFAADFYSYDQDIVQVVADNNHRIIDPMIKAFSVKWPELISDVLAKREYGVDATALNDYFHALDTYLENELDPTDPTGYHDTGNEELESYDYVEEDISKETSSKPTNELVLDEIVETANQKENEINDGTETTTVMVLENRNAITEKPDVAETVKEGTFNQASSNPYVWTGIGLVGIVIIGVVSIILRKRHNHRKELERQRKENSLA